jgi:hypothetical protein
MPVGFPTGSRSCPTRILRRLCLVQSRPCASGNMRLNERFPAGKTIDAARGAHLAFVSPKLEEECDVRAYIRTRRSGNWGRRLGVAAWGFLKGRNAVATIGDPLSEAATRRVQRIKDG